MCAVVITESRGFGANAAVRAAPVDSPPSAARSLEPDEIAGIMEVDGLALEGTPDVVKVAKLSEASLLHNLRVRYARDDIYTRAGSILISVNPFKTLSIYGAERMAEAKNADAKKLQELAPHVYVLAETAFRGMLNEQKQQALLISGESGAGKTEAVKACLRCIVSRSSEAAKGQGGAADGGAARAKYVEDCIMQANPLLEALGNAKTVRNGNSSRFGKWIEVQFDASGYISASRVTSYLLEKSRVTEANHAAVSPRTSPPLPRPLPQSGKSSSYGTPPPSLAKGERTYHSLYQLCRGCTNEQRTQLQLGDPKDFRYIGTSANVAIPNVDDVAWWAETCHAMEVFGLSGADTDGLRHILAAVLHVGNLVFATLKIEQQDDGSKVDDASQPALKALAALVGVATPALESALTVKSVGKFPVVQVPQPPAKATATRDALAKALYGQLFEWTIGRLNGVMGSGTGAADAKRTIGMLDIFGFEAFTKNSLEQLLINFANEKLQEHFNEYIFRMEEAECRAEGVVCPKLEFADNSHVMALMTTRPTGVLSLMNEEVIVPNGSDMGLLGKLQQNHRSNATFKQLPRNQGDGFVVLHYAGPVGYQIEGFVDKNRDQLPGELVQMLGTSQMALVTDLFKPSTADEAPKSARGGGARGRSGGGGGRKATALASQFVDSLDSLMAVLQKTTPHFVRCVKPNSTLQANSLDGSYVMRQLREMGMVHVVRARKQGFAHRYPFDKFTSRYGYMMRGREADAAACAPFYSQHLGTASPPAGVQKDCVTILAVMVADKVLDPDGWAVGTAKVFLKEAMQQQLEVAREQYLLKVVTERLQQAIAAREVPTLESAIAAALEVQLQSPLVVQARQLLSLLQAQMAAAAKLNEAVAARDVGQLEAALTQCANVDLFNETVGQAQQLLQTLKAQAAATGALTTALERNDIAMLEAALAQADGTGLNTGLVQEARRRLDTLRHTAQLEQSLLTSSEGDDLAALGGFLAQAQAINLDTPAVQKARARLEKLQEAARLQEAIATATQQGDAAGVKELIARCRQPATAQTAALSAAVASAESQLREIEANAAARAQAEQRRAEEDERQRQAQAAEAAAALRRAEAEAAAAAAAAASAPQPGSVQPLSAPAFARAASQGGLGGRSGGQAEDVWVQYKEGGKSWPCVPLAQRVALLQAGCPLIKVVPASSRWKVPCAWGGLGEDATRAALALWWWRPWNSFARSPQPLSPYSSVPVRACRWPRVIGPVIGMPPSTSCSRRTAVISRGMRARSRSTSRR